MYNCAQQALYEMRTYATNLVFLEGAILKFIALILYLISSLYNRFKIQRLMLDNCLLFCKITRRCRNLGYQYKFDGLCRIFIVAIVSCLSIFFFSFDSPPSPLPFNLTLCASAVPFPAQSWFNVS